MRRRVNRGNNGATNLNANNSWNVNTTHGFRPVLNSRQIDMITVIPAWLEGDSSRESDSCRRQACEHINNGATLNTHSDTVASTLFRNIVNKKNLDISYHQCMLGKCKYKKDAILFSKQETYNKQNLLSELLAGEYIPGDYHEFYVYEPKKRHIFAPRFRDKLVQRMVYNVIKEIYTPKYIKDSYACIDNRGTHAASDRMQHCLRKARWLYGDGAYIIKLDIKKFFYSIDRRILKGIIEQKIRCAQTLELLYKIIDSLPGEKALPLGNITSHTFANIIADRLDQYCKRYLGIKFYVRYMDDVCMILPDKQQAKDVLEKCITYLRIRLQLEINEKKTKIFPLAQGVNFVGFKTYATHKLLRNQSKRKMKRKLKKMPHLISTGRMSVQKAEQMINSWWGHAQHGCSWNFLIALLRKHRYLSYRNKLIVHKEA